MRPPQFCTGKRVPECHRLMRLRLAIHDARSENGED